MPAARPRRPAKLGSWSMSAAPPTGHTLASARQLLSERFGLEDFRPGQAEVIDALLAGRSALAVFPTGSGKSLSTSCRRCCSTA